MARPESGRSALTPPEPTPATFVWHQRVYYEDTDAGAVVYHARYLNLFERARTEWLRSLGYDQSRLAAERGIVFAIRRAVIDWIAPARLDDVLAVSVEVARVGGARIEFRQLMRRLGTESPGVGLAEAAITAACVDAASFRPRRLPADLRGLIGGQIENDDRENDLRGQK